MKKLKVTVNTKAADHCSICENFTSSSEQPAVDALPSLPGSGVIRSPTEIECIIDQGQFGQDGEGYKLNCKNNGLTTLFHLESILKEEELARKLIPNEFHLCILRGMCGSSEQGKKRARK